jgi:hypothetical protein
LTFARRNRRLTGGFACVLIPAAGLLLAACGGGNDGKSASTTGASREARFVQTVTLICGRGNQRIGKTVEASFERNEPVTAAKIKKIAKETAIPTIQREIDLLRALRVPPRLKARFEALVDDEQAALARLKANPALFASQSENDPFAKAGKLAKRYGLGFCGQGG